MIKTIACHIVALGFIAEAFILTTFGAMTSNTAQIIACQSAFIHFIEPEHLFENVCV